MYKYEAVNCNNFDGVETTTMQELSEGCRSFLCYTRNCVDREDCDKSVIQTIPEAHFEPKIKKEE